MQQIVSPLVFADRKIDSFLKSPGMQWNALITRIQYENALKRVEEIGHALPNSSEEDELILLRIMIKDYEQRQVDLWGSRIQKSKLSPGKYYPNM
jgi:hypothetical protein